MHHAISSALLAAALLGEGAVSAQSGLGLRPSTAQAADRAFGGEAAQLWQSQRPSDFALYGGSRETALWPAQSYAGIVYSLPRGWASSLEAGQALESPIAPRSYALTGQLHSALSDGRTMSVGLKYRVYDTDVGVRQSLESTPTNGFTLAPYRLPGASYSPSYQLQFSYQHSPASSFGLALGRDLETFTPHSDPLGSGPRQFSFTGQHWLTPSWALSYDVLSQDATAPLRALGLRLGVRYRW